jgi:hypothetical protein
MQLMAGDQQVPLGSALYRRGLEQFRANLAALLARYRAAGVPVFVGTVASNERDQPPFVSPPAAAGDTSAAALRRRPRRRRARRHGGRAPAPSCGEGARRAALPGARGDQPDHP